MASFNQFLRSVATTGTLTLILAGCGGTDGSRPISDVDGSAGSSRNTDALSSLPTVAIPTPKLNQKNNATATSTATEVAKASPSLFSKSGKTTATTTKRGDEKKTAETANSAIATEPEKGSPEWLLLEIQRIRVLPLPVVEEDLDDDSEENDDGENDEEANTVRTQEQDERLRKQLDQQRAVRCERNTQIIKLAEECIAKTNKAPNLEQQFDTAAHQLLDARFQLALQGDVPSIDALFDAAKTFYERNPLSESALEAQLTLVNLTHASALRYGKSEPKWIQEFAKHSQILANHFPEEQGRVVPLLAAAGRTCDMNGLPQDAIRCYSLLMTLSKDSPQARQAQGVVRRLQLIGKPMELAGPTMDGNDLNIESYRGKMVVVVFWASHVKPFVDQLPKLIATTKKYEKYAAVIGVNLDTEEPAVETFLEKTSLTWPQIFSPQREQRGWNSPLAIHYGIDNLPTIWIVDPKGIVVETSTDVDTLAAKLHETYLPYLKSTAVKPAGATR